MPRELAHHLSGLCHARRGGEACRGTNVVVCPEGERTRDRERGCGIWDVRNEIRDTRYEIRDVQNFEPQPSAFSLQPSDRDWPDARVSFSRQDLLPAYTSLCYLGPRDERERRDGGEGIRDTSRGIRDIQNLESRIPNFGSRLSRMSRASRFDGLTVPSHVEGRATVCGGGAQRLRFCRC